MELPASEIEFWRVYYDIFPFPQEREDARTALLAEVISNMSGRTLKEAHLAKVEDFMPAYLLDEREKEERFVKRQIEREMKMGQKFLQGKDAQ